MPGMRALTSAMAAAACATGLAACGGEDENGPIPPEQGNQLLERLSEIEAAVDQGDCDRAQQLALGFDQDVGALPLDDDPELRNALVEASGNLESLTEDPEQCTPDTGATGETGIVPTETTPTTETTETTPTTTTTDEESDDRGKGNGPPDRPPGGGNDDRGGGNDDDDDDSSGGIGSD